MEWLHGWLGLILGFSGLIFIHELGHFLLAKWNGVKVHVFSLGWGPYIFSFTWRGTVYALSLIPIGGYVSMAGQSDTEVDDKPTKDPQDYRNKTVGQRAQIIAAGAIFNVAFTIFAFTMCFWWGMEIEPPRIGMISPDKPLAKATLLTDPNKPANLQEGDRIIEVNGVPVKSFLEAMLQISATPRNGEIEMRVERQAPVDGDRYAYVRVGVERDKKIGAQNIGLNQYRMEMKLPLGFTTEDKVVISDGWAKTIEKDPKEAEKSPAWQAGLKDGDELLRVGDQDVKTLDDMTLAAPRSKGEPTKIVIRRAGEIKEFTVKPRYDDEEGRHFFGIPTKPIKIVKEIDPNSEAAKQGLQKGHYVWRFDFTKRQKWVDKKLVVEGGTLSYSSSWDTPEKEFKKFDLEVPQHPKEGALIYSELRKAGEFYQAENFGEALSVAWGDTLRFSGSVFTVLRGLFTGDVSVKALSGGLGIGHAVYIVASDAPFLKFIWFLGFISLNLGVLQFVPIPLLDGFHLVLLAIEKLKGSPVAAKVQMTFQWVGILIVGSLILLATYNDITRIFLK